MIIFIRIYEYSLLFEIFYHLKQQLMLREKEF